MSGKSEGEADAVSTGEATPAARTGVNLHMACALGTLMLGLIGCRPAEAAAPVVQSPPKSSWIGLRYTPEEGLRGLVQLQLEVAIHAPFEPVTGTSDAQECGVRLQLCSYDEAFSFLETPRELSLRPESITIEGRSALWEGGQPVHWVLGDFQMPLPAELAGDPRRSSVRGVMGEGTNGSFFFGWAASSVEPLTRNEEWPGQDYLVYGGQVAWAKPLAQSQAGRDGEPNLKGNLAVATRTGTIPPAPGAPGRAPESYRETAGMLSASLEWWDQMQAAGSKPGTARKNRIEGWAAWQTVAETFRSWGLWWEQEWRGERQRLHRVSLGFHSVPAGFLPWAARRSESKNRLYRWRGETAVASEGTAWVSPGWAWPGPPMAWKLQWDTAAGLRACEGDGEQERGFARGRLQAEGTFPDGTCLAGVRCRLRANVDLTRQPEPEPGSPAPAGEGGLTRAGSGTVTEAWADLRLSRQAGAWTPWYMLRWQNSTPSQDGDESAGGEGDEDAPSDAPAGDDGQESLLSRLTHTLGFAVDLPVGPLEGLKATWTSLLAADRPPVHSVAVSYMSPAGWEWQLKWTWPDDPDRTTDCRAQLRSRFGF